MQTLKLKENIYWVGILDAKLKVFDIIMETKFGTSYNSYLIKGTKKNVLIETAKFKFFDEYLDNIKQHIEIKDIDYIIINHTEPDHTGSVEKILELNPNITLVGSRSAIQFIGHIVNMEFKSLVVDTGDSLDLGNKTLQFISAPKLHWPDSMYTYLPEDEILFTCDSFGAHYCLDLVLQSKLEFENDYFEALKYYYDMILSPFKSSLLKAIDKIKDLKINMICTGHGPVLDSNPWDVINKCKNWASETNPNSNLTVIIPYVSAYGYTELIAKKISEGIVANNVDTKLYDMTVADKNEVLSEIYWAEGVLLGSPTMLSDALKPIWDITIGMFPDIHGGKFASAFGSYGWSGEAVPNLLVRLKQLKLRVLDEGYKVKFNPNKEEIDQAVKFGEEFANIIKKNCPK